MFRYEHVTDESLLAEFGKNVSSNLKTSLTESETRDFRLRLSAIGKPSRQIHYQATDAPRELLQSQVFFKFQYGHVLEEMVLYLAKEAGHEVLDEQAETVFEGIKGHIDAVIDGVLVDVKSASPFGFVKFKNGTIRENDSFNYIPQLASYYQSRGHKNGAAFLAINKVSGEICVCPFSHEEMMAVDVSSHVLRQKRVVDNLQKVPTRCFDDKPDGASGNRALGTECGYCAFKHHCWRDANGGKGLRTFLYSNKPKYLTEVKRLPKVLEASAPQLHTNK